MALDLNIYGIDDNDFASGIASSALSSANPNAHSGSPIDQGARSKGADGERNDGTEDKFPVGHEVNSSVVKSDRGQGNDSRAHTKGNHGEQD